MAEPLSIAASAIQVAGAGLKLAVTLKSYIDSVRKAEKQLRPVADHIILTSDILTERSTLLSNEDMRYNLYTAFIGFNHGSLERMPKSFRRTEYVRCEDVQPDCRTVHILVSAKGA